MTHRRKWKNLHIETNYEVSENVDESESEKESINNNIEKRNEKEKTIHSFYQIYYPIVKNIYLLASKTIRLLLKISGIYLLWICLHYGASHLYIKFCVPTTIMGFIMSPFMVSTPHCQGLRWIVYNAATIINNMWLALGAWIYTLLWITKENSTPVSSP